VVRALEIRLQFECASWTRNSNKGDSMKFQDIIRMQAIVIAIGAVLFLASQAPAQEIVNKEFSDGPNVATFQPPTATTSATVTPAAQAPKADVTDVAALTPMMAEEATTSFQTNTSVVIGLVVSFLFLLAAWAIYQVLRFRRATS